MVRVTLKTLFRNLSQYKTYSFINIFGLAIGLVCCLVIFLYVADELSYDHYHADAQRIYRVATIVKSGNDEKPFARGLTPLIPVLRAEFPEVEQAVRFQYWATSGVKVEYGGREFIEQSLMVTEPDLFRVFTIPFVVGDPSTALARPGTIVITREISEKIFGSEPPQGKSIKVGGEEYEISGVVENPPENTHLQYDIMLSLTTVQDRMNMNNWGWTGFYSYVKLASGTNPEEFEKRISTIARKYIGPELDKVGVDLVLFLQPLTDIHLHSHVHREIKPPGSVTNVYVFSTVGILVLVVACINFMNLATARSMQRAKETGMRKVLGANRGQLIVQFMTEFAFMTLIAFLLALILLEFIFPVFNGFSGKHFTLSDLLQPQIAFGVIGLLVVVAVLAGSYPALFLSAVRPIRVLQGSWQGGRRGKLTRRLLVVWQFAISIALIIGTLLIDEQIQYMKDEDLGFDREQKLILPARLGPNVETVKAEFLRHPGITGATASSNVPGRIDNSLVTTPIGSGNGQGHTILYNFVDYDYIPEYGLDVIAGRGFTKGLDSEQPLSFVLNEAAVGALGLGTPEEALGRQLDRGNGRGRIVGVVRDFHISGLQNAIPPHIMLLSTSGFSQLTLTIRADKIGETIASIKDTWNALHLGNIFSYSFLDEDFDRLYSSEEALGSLFSVSTVLGIIVASLGLLGLASFLTERRTKEIGIRKVLGASRSNVVTLLSRDFLVLVLAGNILAWPMAWLAMRSWLQDFAYRIEIAWWVFPVAGGTALLVALMTVGGLALRSAGVNPAESLRYE